MPIRSTPHCDGPRLWVGARAGQRLNADVISRIRESVDCRLQLGGGIRTMEDVASVAALGIDRIVIGSAAVTHPELVSSAVGEFGSAIAVGLDARDGKLATQGWKEQTEVLAVEAAQRFAANGVEHFIFTDIRRDGRLEGPNLQALREMIEQVPANIIASGGISSLEDVTAVRDLGSAGVITGAALYHRKFTLPEALAIATQETPA
jgi:phosphoribosylformimino-5-aminoimidazole carboxamide ribotide isomerase